MKTALLRLLCCSALLTALLPNKAEAQNCTSCSLTISTAWSSPLAAGPGVTICITSSGSVTGDIIVNGGTLCNEGSILSHNILLTSGTINNYGSMDVVNLAASQGSFNNEGTAVIDSLSQSGSGTSFYNGDSLSGLAHSLYNQSTFENYGNYSYTNTSVSYGSSFYNSEKFCCVHCCKI